MATKSKGLAGKGRVAFQVSGLGSSQKALNALPIAVQKRVIRQAIRASMKPVKAAVQREAPIGDSGDLRSHVKLRAVQSKGKGKNKGKGGIISFQVQIGMGDYKGEMYYAAMVEFGHAIRAVPKGPEIGRVPANPFMQRAFDQTKDRARRHAVAAILRGVALETRRLSDEGKS